MSSVSLAFGARPRSLREAGPCAVACTRFVFGCFPQPPACDIWPYIPALTSEDTKAETQINYFGSI